MSIATDDLQPPVWIDIAYALISLGSTAIWAVMSGWLLYFYLPPEGEGIVLVPAAMYGAVTLFIRAINALLATPVGYLSDRTRSRWGRRLPFMFVSALPMLAFFVLLWTPPVRGLSVWNLVYLAVVLAFYNLAYTLNQIPYTALLPELARTDRHRVRISAWSSSFFILGMVLSALAGPLIDRLGYLGMALVYAGVSLPMFYLPFLALREDPRRQGTLYGSGFYRSVATMLRNRAFRVMTAAGALYWGTTALIQGAIPFIVTEVCRLSKGDTLYFYAPALLASLLCYPLITWLSYRFGKWWVFAGSLLASAAVLPTLFLIGERWGISLRAQGIAWITLQAVAMSGVTMLPPAFGAEIAEHDAELTGQYREGTYYAAWGLLDQVISGVAAAFLPVMLMLGRSQNDPHGPLGVRLVGPLCGLLMLIAFIIFMRYPLRVPGAERA